MKAMHAQEGLFFERIGDEGQVRIFCHRTSGSADEFSVTVDHALWASIVVAVSEQGSTTDRWMTALAFHQEPPAVHIPKPRSPQTRNMS